MTMLSPTASARGAILSFLAIAISAFHSCVQVIDDKLAAQRAESLRRRLDKGTLEDFGLETFAEIGGEAQANALGPLREVLSWTRFAK